ncbi:MAG: hypothetical protein FE78DRAFT_275936 [Acidomyces sp. 'richmondensis']|nr:MAG: hypothetical protein FE78DRAFT_275936 [Acidomyces sp. 'richmondensis']
MALGLVVGCGALCTYTNYLSLLVPENSADNILRRRAQRLRKRTGHLKLKSKSELAQTNLPLSEAIRDALIKPMEICQRSCCDLQQNLVLYLLLNLRSLSSRLSPHLSFVPRAHRAYLHHHWHRSYLRSGDVPQLSNILSYPRLPTPQPLSTRIPPRPCHLRCRAPALMSKLTLDYVAYWILHHSLRKILHLPLPLYLPAAAIS